MTRQLKQQHIAQELAKRLAANAETFTPEAVVGNHSKQQLAYIKSTARYVLACCSRQAGKTHANMAILALTAMATPRVACIYIGISSDQVRRSAWRKIWKPMLAKYKLPATSTEDMTTTFANGSTVIFRSLDDERHVSTFLGDSLASGICIIDECQDASSELLETVERAIEPCLINTTAEKPVPGRLIWSGTFPETPTGRYWNIYKGGSTSYDRHTWCMFDNTFYPNARTELESVKARLGVTDQEPHIQREYFGNPVYDITATAYGFNPNKNFYQHITPVWESTLSLPPFVVKAAIPVDCTTYVIGIDPAGTTDRYAIEVWGWGPESPNVYQVFEAITAKGANPLQSQANAVVAAISRLYTGVAGIVRDHGSAAVTDDTLLHEFGIGNVEPAVKAELKARVDRFRDLLGTGRAFVMKDSALAEDLALSRWDLRARERGQWRWHSSHHPDAADAAVYAIGKYISLYQPDPEPVIESFGEAMQRRAREAFTNPNRNIQYGPPADNFGGHENTSTDYGGPPRNI